MLTGPAGVAVGGAAGSVHARVPEAAEARAAVPAPQRSRVHWEYRRAEARHLSGCAVCGARRDGREVGASAGARRRAAADAGGPQPAGDGGERVVDDAVDREAALRGAMPRRRVRGALAATTSHPPPASCAADAVVHSPLRRLPLPQRAVVPRHCGRGSVAAVVRAGGACAALTAAVAPPQPSPSVSTRSCPLFRPSTQRGARSCPLGPLRGRPASDAALQGRRVPSAAGGHGGGAGARSRWPTQACARALSDPGRWPNCRRLCVCSSWEGRAG